MAARVGDRVLGDAFPGERIRDVALVVGYAVLVGLVAQISIPLPFTPVPITGQTFGVLLGGMALGWRRAALGMLLYAAAGAAGAPWFAQHRGGVGIILGPTGGYILSYIPAGALVGRLAELGWDRRPDLTLLSMAAGSAIIYILGVGVLMFDLHLTFAQGLAFGMTPFLFGDAIKALLAAGLLPGARRLAGRRA